MRDSYRLVEITTSLIRRLVIFDLTSIEIAHEGPPSRKPIFWIPKFSANTEGLLAATPMASWQSWSTARARKSWSPLRKLTTVLLLRLRIPTPVMKSVFGIPSLKADQAIADDFELLSLRLGVF